MVFACIRIFGFPVFSSWFFRAALRNSCQVAIVILSGVLWSRWLPARSLFHFRIHTFSPRRTHRMVLGDITLWDRLFGTFLEAEDFALKCGFPDDHEKNLD